MGSLVGSTVGHCALIPKAKVGSLVHNLEKMQLLLESAKLMAPYTAPNLHGDAFTCPHCQAFATQLWGPVIQLCGNLNRGNLSGWALCTCFHCGAVTIWRNESIAYPQVSTAPLSSPDLPQEIASDYNEARNVLPISPRGAAALLRLCIQKLCAALGEKGENINEDIKSLVAKGLSPQIQQSLDIVRVVGNNAVHPGQLDLKDDHETASKLFGLINLIVEVMITQPKHIKAMYDAVVPSSLQAAIQKRDSSS